MSNTKNNKKKKDNSHDEFQERVMEVDVQYEDIPVDKKDPVIMKSRAIQQAHTMAMIGIVTSIVPIIGLIIGILAYLKLKGLGQIPYDLRMRYASAKALAKGAIAASIVMMIVMVFVLSTGMIK